MGSKPDTSAADTANQQAAQQAAEARQKEAERQAHLDQGKTAIENTFSGSPVMGTKSTAFDWGSFAPPAATAMATQDASGTWHKGVPAASGVPAGYTAIQVDDPNWKPAGGAASQPLGSAVNAAGLTRRADYNPNAGMTPAAAAGAGGKISGFGTFGTMNGMLGGGTNQGSGGGAGGTPQIPATASGGASAAAQGPGKVWAIRGPDGQLHYQGQGFNVDSQYDTGQRSGGFGDDFYSGISKKVMDLGNVDITDQYNKARENLQYALARQGLSSSSAANQGVADTEAAKAKAQGDLSLQATDAANQVRSQVDQEKQAALAQLYATEDPSLSANTALGKATNIRADQPAYSGLGDIFGSVIQGFGNVYSAARNAGGGYFAGNKSPSVRPAGG